MNVVPTLLMVPGRILIGPDVKYHNNKPANTRFGSWNMANTQFSSSSALTHWSYLLISAKAHSNPWRNEQELKGTIDAFTEVLRSSGICAESCSPGKRIIVDPSNPEAEVDNAIHQYKRTPGKGPQKMLLVILPYVDTVIYRRVKYVCDIREGLLNVCVIASKFARATSQYLANVALKVNLKLGGRNQFLDKDELGYSLRVKLWL
jgi:hypothetical protein